MNKKNGKIIKRHLILSTQWEVHGGHLPWLDGHWKTGISQ